MVGPLVMMLLAQVAAPPAPAATGPAPATASKSNAKATADQGCSNELPTEPGEIVVCAQKPDGYRINPDILAAKKAVRDRRKSKGPERYVDKSCETVGPMGCRGTATVDLLGAALVAASMVQKAASGGNVGKMFITDPQPSEYQLYLEAKRIREEKEAEAAIAASRKAASPQQR